MSSRTTTSGQPSIPRISGRTQWLTWFLGMLATAAVLYGMHAVFGYANGITWVIIGLFFLSLFKSYVDVAFLERETRLASEQVDQLSSLNDIQGFLDAARPSIFRSHIEALHNIFLNDSKIDQDSLVEVVHARLMARIKVVDLFASILITLGLIGTILGLIGAQTGLEVVLTEAGGDSESLFEGMKTTIGGLGTAFFTTLFGAIFGGVVLRILTSVVDANILGYMAHLAELTEVHVLPALRRTASRLEAGGYYRKVDARTA